MPPTAIPPSGRPLTALVADNDADMRRYIRRGLRLLDRPVGQVVEAADGEAALASMRDAPVDVVITDLAMPRLDGLALCAAIVADPALRSVPVLIVTGEASQERVRHAMDARLCWAQLAKPFNAVTLADRVGQLLSAS